MISKPSFRLLSRSFYVAQLSNTKTVITLQHVKSNNSLKNLNRVFDHSKWMTLHLNCLLGNYKLNCLNSLRPDPQEKSWQKRSKAKHNCFGGFCEYKYSMVDWSIITELQIQNILRKCQWLYIPKWMHFIFSPVSKCWKKLFRRSIFVRRTEVHQSFCNTVSAIGRMLTLNTNSCHLYITKRKSLETSITF